MKKLYAIVFLLSAAACFAQTERKEVVTQERLGNVLDCLVMKLGPQGYAPKQATSEGYLVRYFYGVLTPGYEKVNELQLFAYRPGGDAADFYRVYFEEQDKQKVIFIGEGGTIKKEGDHMVPDEIPGGVASYDEFTKLLRIISNQSAITIPESKVRPGSDGCIYQG